MQAKAVRPEAGAVPVQKASFLTKVYRLLILLTGMMVFFPQFNPGRICLKINQNASLFTTAFSYETITNSLALPLRRGWVEPWHFYLLMAGAAAVLLGIMGCAAGGCMSLGNRRMQRAGTRFAIGGAAAMGAGLGVIAAAYHVLLNAVTLADKVDRVEPVFPTAIWILACWRR